MRREPGRRSKNVEDRHGISVRRRRLVQGAIGVVIVVLIAWYFLGANPTLQQVEVDSSGGIAGSSAPAPAEDPEVAFVSSVLDDTEDAWSAIFRATGSAYAPPTLVLFSGAAPSACSFTEIAMGPFYCPGNRKLYIDLDFLRELRQRFPAPGDSAAAYVIAHEIGHHVQNLTGSSKMVQQLLETASKDDPDMPPGMIALMAELQADCYAGIWVKHSDRTRHLFQQGDVEEALAAATTIGNDLLRQKARGYVMPDSFTHGTAAQRLRWFRTGLTKGDIESCETFATPEL